MSYQVKIDPRKRKAGRFIGKVRSELLKAFAEEKNARKLTQQAVATTLGVDRSVVNRMLTGESNLTLRSVADLAFALDRDITFALVKPQTVGNERSDTIVFEDPRAAELYARETHSRVTAAAHFVEI